MNQCKIEAAEIVIRIPISTLPIAYQAGIDLGYVTSGFKITDPHKFAVEVVNMLLDEDEEGTTLIHRAFDKAMEKAVENCAEGCEEIDIVSDQEGQDE